MMGIKQIYLGRVATYIKSVIKTFGRNKFNATILVSTKIFPYK